MVDKTAGRPRDPRIDAAILAATVELVAEVGYANLTLAAVAERAGTTKSALYRRWSGKADLVHEAVFSTSPDALEAVAPGDVAADIRAMVVATRDVLTSPAVRAVYPGLIADMATDPELGARVLARFAAFFEAMQLWLTAAYERGDAQPDVDSVRLIEMIGGATLFWLLLNPADTPGDDWVDQITAIVTRGVVT